MLSLAANSHAVVKSLLSGLYAVIIGHSAIRQS